MFFEWAEGVGWREPRIGGVGRFRWRLWGWLLDAGAGRSRGGRGWLSAGSGGRGPHVAKNRNAGRGLGTTRFRSSIPSLPVPLSTLRLRLATGYRMTRGQDGSLLLSCTTLAFATQRWFYQSLPNLEVHATGADSLAPWRSAWFRYGFDIVSAWAGLDRPAGQKPKPAPTERRKRIVPASLTG